MRLPLLLTSLLATACATTSGIPPAWTSLPEATRIRTLSLGSDGRVTIMAPPPVDSPIRVEGNRLYRGEKAITEAFAAIDSFDYSTSRDEVIFSAKKEGGYDIGLAAGDGTQTNWIPADPADEQRVQWAPRGNKISYVVRAPLGDVVRTLHVPTSFQFSIDFGAARVHALAWEAAAEKYAVSYSTLDASDRVEVLHYDGSQRSVAVPPSARIPADVISFAPNAFAFRPQDLRYGEKLPVVVWVTDRFEWSDARAALMKNARTAIVVVKGKPDAKLWQSIAETAWLDASRTYVVGARNETAVSIVADPALPAGRYQRTGNVVAVSPAAIQSFAAGFIADQLKRTGPTNGSSR